MGEYRIEELATRTETTVRTLQSYKTLGLLPPPRREGRVAYYSQVHVDRLRLISDLVSRGYSLSAIAELLDGLGRGDRIHDLLGIEESLGTHTDPDSSDTALDGDGRTVDRAEVERRTSAVFSVEDLLALGVIVRIPQVDDRYRVVLPGVFESGEELVLAGIPADAVLEEGVRLTQDADQIAERFVRLVADSVIVDGAVTPATHASSVTELVTRLVPLAERVVADYLRVALQRQIGLEIERQIGGMVHTEADDG